MYYTKTYPYILNVDIVGYFSIFSLFFLGITVCGHKSIIIVIILNLYKLCREISILIKVLFVCVCIRHTFCGKFKGFVNYISVVISMMLLLFQITFILVKWLLLFQIIFSHKMFSDQVCKQKAAIISDNIFS